MTDSTNNLYTNKIQIRARLLSAIVNLQTNSQDIDFIHTEISELKEIPDKQSVMDILLKELLKDNSEIKDYTISFLLKELTEKDELEKKLFSALANKQIKDSVKTKIVSILRDSGNHIKYEQYSDYFENPDEIIDSDTEKLLENAKINPESQIDFLDFLTALPIQEKEVLLNSLKEDYDGDNLANILIPVVLANPYSEEAQFAIQALGETRSKLTYPVIKELLDKIEEPKIKSNLQKSLSLLKLSGIKEDQTKEYYKNILSDSPIHNCSISFPDGHGNIGLIFSRKNSLDIIKMFALVLNDKDGIVDCFGFNEITQTEYARILAKFYQNNDVIKISPTIAKYLMCTAEDHTRKKYGDVPYEYIIWKVITNDIEYEEIDLKSRLTKEEKSLDDLKNIYNKNYFNTWFMTENDSDIFRDLMNNIISEKIEDTAKIEDLANDCFEKLYTTDFVSVFNKRLLICSYLAHFDKRDADSSMLYYLTFESELKHKFLNDYLKKSIYQYFLNIKDKYDSLKKSTSIFSKKDELREIDIKYTELCIKNIEKHWV